jgi:uncharacterized RDD family membrane protein YckC
MMQNQEIKTPTDMQYAGFWLRVGAYLIDELIFFIPLVVINVAAGLLTSLTSDSILIALISITMALLVAVLYGLYGGLFESSRFQATPGKMLLKIKVTDIQGNRCSFVRAFARYIGMGISDATFYIGYLMAIWTEKKQCLHDKVANCLVIRA